MKSMAPNVAQPARVRQWDVVRGEGIAGSDLVHRRVVTAVVAAAALGSCIGAAAATSPVPQGDAALVGGRPLVLHTVRHWMWIAARTQAAGSPGSPVIVPTDPPRFGRCIATVRHTIPSLSHTPVRDLRRDCRTLFTSMANQVMGFLIEARWYEAQARIDGIKITEPRVLHAFHQAERQQFASRRSFRQFLKLTGQTVPDVLFRFRLNLLVNALLRAEHRGPGALENEVAGRYRPDTECAPYYVMADCANSTNQPMTTGSGSGSFTGSFFSADHGA